jgi:hypothetical protein
LICLLIRINTIPPLLNMKKNSAARQKEVNEAVRILNTTTRWRG